MGRKPRIRADMPGKVIDWIKSADADEIAEALLAVDEAKAVLVVVKLAERTEGEARRLLDSVGKEFDADPVGTIARGLVGTLSRLGRGG